MAYHDITTCSKTFQENIDLKHKLRCMKRIQEELKGQLLALSQEKDKEEGAIRRCTKNGETQTDSKIWLHRPISAPMKGNNVPPTVDIGKTNKVLDMHAQLLKRYDKEVKLNMNYADTISDLHVRLAEGERKLREEKEKILQLERELVMVKRKKGSQVCEDPVLREVVKERNSLAKVNKLLRTELQGLDKNFFDEIEDLKFALLQSSQLNKEYEKCLKQMSSNFGVPCPQPQILLKQKTGQF